MSWYTITNKGPDCTEILIFDEIGYWGITAKKFAEDLAAVKTKKITLRINSPGGVCYEAFAIFNALRDHPATINVKIEGLAASAASVIAMAGDTICMGRLAFLMIHNVMSGAWGYSCDLRKEADLVDKLTETVASTYVKRTGRTLAEIQKKMDEETWFDAAEAKAFGLCDSISSDEDGEELDSVAFVNATAKAAIKFKLPERLRRLAASLGTSPSSSTPPPPKAPSHTEIPMAAKITIRDGKQFVNIDGKEHEIEAPAAPVAAAPAAPVAPTNGAPKVFTEQDIVAAREEGTKNALKYATDFETAVAAAGMTPKVAADFKTKFYGRPIDDIKFLASNAIGARATAVGEGGSADGAGEGAPSAPVAAEKKIAEDEGKRFDSESGTRRVYGRLSDDPTNDEYKRRRQQHIDGHLKFHRDNLAKKAKASAA